MTNKNEQHASDTSGELPEWMCSNRDCGIWWHSDDETPRCPECGSAPLV
jgi:rubrerythrin